MSRRQPLPDPESPTRARRRGHGRKTLADVAAQAGVTSITVSRFLREPERVAASTAARVREALQVTGYTPNKAAGGLASGGSRIVAALLPNLANSIFGETAQGLADGLQHAGFELLISSTAYSLDREEEQLRAVLGWQPAAIVVTGRHHSIGGRAMLQAAQARGTPVIELWDHHDPGAEGFAQVGFSHDEIGRAMAQHLLDGGHRQLAYVDSGIAEDYRAHERGLAFSGAALHAGATVQVIVAPPGDAFDAGRQVLQVLADAWRGRRAERISAMAFANDHLASGALLEAMRLRIRVPHSLALLGFGDFAVARQLSPALSSVQLPRYQIGAEAARRLVAALRGGEPVQSSALTWALVARQSTASMR